MMGLSKKCRMVRMRPSWEMAKAVQPVSVEPVGRLETVERQAVVPPVEQAARVTPVPQVLAVSQV